MLEGPLLDCKSVAMQLRWAVVVLAVSCVVADARNRLEKRVYIVISTHTKKKRCWKGTKKASKANAVLPTNCRCSHGERLFVHQRLSRSFIRQRVHSATNTSTSRCTHNHSLSACASLRFCQGSGLASTVRGRSAQCSATAIRRRSGSGLRSTSLKRS